MWERGPQTSEENMSVGTHIFGLKGMYYEALRFALLLGAKSFL